MWGQDEQKEAMIEHFKKEHPDQLKLVQEGIYKEKNIDKHYPVELRTEMSEIINKCRTRVCEKDAGIRDGIPRIWQTK